MSHTRVLGWVRSIGSRGIISTVGILLSVFLFPKLFPVWFFQLLGGIGGILHAVVGQLLYAFANREWLLGAAFVGGYIKAALDEIDDEREFTNAELEALEAFAADVRSMTVHGGTVTGTNAAVLAKSGTEAEKLGEIRTRYRETMMSIPNYDSVYDEGITESFTAEFGEDLATVVTNGTQFNRPVQQLLLRQVSSSVIERERHLDTLATERRSVVDGGERLADTNPVLERTDPRGLIHCSFDELLEFDRDIQEATNECAQLLEDRQHDIHTSNQQHRPQSDRTLLQEYLYRPLDVTFPVLVTTMDRIRTLDERRRAVVRSIARRY